MWDKVVIRYRGCYGVPRRSAFVIQTDISPALGQGSCREFTTKSLLENRNFSQLKRLPSQGKILPGSSQYPMSGCERVGQHGYRGSACLCTLGLRTKGWPWRSPPALPDPACPISYRRSWEPSSRNGTKSPSPFLSGEHILKQHTRFFYLFVFKSL